MQIRITTELVEHGTVQFLRGQVLTLPDELAQQFLDAGDAEKTNIRMPRRASIAGFVPQAQKAKRS